MQTLRSYAIFGCLVAVKILARPFYRFELTWIDDDADRRPDPWSGLRVAAVLHHTSLFDVLFVAALPPRMLWLLARRAVAPGADVTLDRPIVGRLIPLLVHRMIAITRQRDETWDALLDAIDDDAVVVLAPEGRMMRKDGLDKNGQPMTVRGGIADVLEAAELRPGRGDRLLILYSQGLHHVQAPGERFPRLFQTVAAKLESVPIGDYLADRRQDAERDGVTLRRSIIQDLERRRDIYCPVPSRAVTQ